MAQGDYLLDKLTMKEQQLSEIFENKTNKQKSVMVLWLTLNKLGSKANGM